MGQKKTKNMYFLCIGQIVDPITGPDGEFPPISPILRGIGYAGPRHSPRVGLHYFAQFIWISQRRIRRGGVCRRSAFAVLRIKSSIWLLPMTQDCYQLIRHLLRLIRCVARSNPPQPARLRVSGRPISNPLEPAGHPLRQGLRFQSRRRNLWRVSLKQRRNRTQMSPKISMPPMWVSGSSFSLGRPKDEQTSKCAILASLNVHG